MSEYVSDFKLKQDIAKYKQMGLDEKTAIIVACSINNVSERANDILCELGDEQAELKKCLKEMIEVSKQIFSDLESKKDEDFPQKFISDNNVEDVKNEKSDIEC
jgi:hypothetical protein